MNVPQRVGIVANLEKETALSVARRLKVRLEDAGREVFLHPLLGRALDAPPPDPLAYGRSDLLVSLGGDGTLLATVRSLDGGGAPVLGINLGGLGFLTAVSSTEVEDCLEAILSGRFAVEERHLLTATFREEGGGETVIEALNEIVMDEGTFSRRAVVLKVQVDGSYVGTLTADGLIVATPTGSTAYSLSAGGPILKPTLPALVLTPICAHSLAIRPLVFGEDEEVVVENLLAGVTLKITGDGQEAFRVADGSTVRVRRSDRKVRLAFLRDRSYYEILRSKLNWGGIPKDR